MTDVGKLFVKVILQSLKRIKKSARSYALESGWVEIGNKHYCPDCFKFNDILSPYV